MMLSPENFARQFKNSSLKECLEVRDQLLEELKKFECSPDYSSDSFPCPLTQYLVNTDYLKELCDLITQKIRSNDPANMD